MRVSRRTFSIVFVAYLAFCLAVMGLIGYVAFHFIAKYW